MKPTLIFLLAAMAAVAQQKDDGNKLVTVPQRYVSAEGLTHTVEPSASNWVGIGREIGEATRAGLLSVVDVAEKFGATNVGHFVMAMVAWKVIGADAKRIVLGIPLLLGGVALWMWSLRRFFFGAKRIKKYDAATKTKEYEYVKYAFESGDGRGVCAFAHIVAAAALMALVLIIVV